MSHSAPFAGGRRLLVWSAGAALGGALLLGAGALLDRRQACFSLLAAWGWGLSVVFGALVFLMMGHALGARWPVVVRRITETVAATLPFYGLLFVPLAVAAPSLWPWADPAAGAADPRLAHALLHERPWLDLSFVATRAAVYFILWSGVAWALRTWSLHEDRGGGAGLQLRQRVLAAVGLPLVALTFTAATIDWFMSLSPTWVSTVYGIYWFAGGFLGAIAVLVILSRRLVRRWARRDHFHALGRILLVFVIFWAYIAYAQGFIISIADRPEESAWYLPRLQGGWATVLGILGIGHFLVPFVLLLSRDLKRRPRALAALGAWLLAMHWLDVQWLVLPALHGEGFQPHWMDLAALLLVAGGTTALGTFLLRGHALVPHQDPRLPEALAYRSGS